jgi:4'-phosphopantetheinyl transferase EntD
MCRALHQVTTGRYDRSSDEDHHQDAPQSKASAWRARLERKQKHLAAKVFSRVHASTHRREEAPGSPPDRPEL